MCGVSCLTVSHTLGLCAKMFLDYTIETYGKYLQGADTFEDEDEVHFHKLSKNSL